MFTFLPLLQWNLETIGDVMLALVCVCVCVCVCAHVYSSAVSYTKMGFPGCSAAKIPSANAGATGKAGSIPGSGRASGGRNGNLLQYSCLENPMEREVWGLQSMGLQRIGHD